MSDERFIVKVILLELSKWVWDVQNFAYSFSRSIGINTSETTLTESLLLHILSKGERSGIKTKEFSNRNEPNIGADWEWYFNLPECCIGYRVQAKKLYKSIGKPGQYKKLKFGEGSQTDILIEKAKKKNPIFVFYNHGYVGDAKTHFSNKTHPRYNIIGPEFLGCSFASALSVRDIGQKKLSNLFPKMHPLFRLVDCPNVNSNTGNITFESGIHLDDEDRYIVNLLKESESKNIDFNSNQNDHNLMYLREYRLKGVALIDFTSTGKYRGDVHR